jgi:hypothetical protein
MNKKKVMNLEKKPPNDDNLIVDSSFTSIR